MSAAAEEFANEDRRIKFVSGRRTVISRRLQQRARTPTGEFVALLDHDDELTEHALYMVAEELNAFPEPI